MTKLFGRLLRRMRGDTPLETLAKRTRLSADYLRSVENGRGEINEIIARHICEDGFALDADETDRVILGLNLYELGLKDNDLRQLVIDLIRKEAPREIRTSLKRLYRSYADTE